MILYDEIMVKHSFNGVLEKEGLDKFPTMLKINIFERMFHNDFILQYFSELR